MSGIERHYLIPPPVIQIENDGPLLKSTNYWQTDNAAAGLFFLSTNAGCVRLLVPPRKRPEIADMTRNVREIVLTRGMFEGVADTVEIMFEDGSETPFCIHIDPKQVDRLWLPADQAKRWRFAIWTEQGKVAEFARCYLRRAPRLPYAARWQGRR